MEIRQLTDQISVAPQITAADVAAIKDAGFQAIICHRPNGEGADQPAFEEIEKAAKSAGLVAAYLPVEAGNICEQDVIDLSTTLDDLPRPILGYCRSGARVAMLWSLHQDHQLAKSET